MPTEEKTTQIKYKNIEWKVISNPKKDSLLDLQKKHRFHDLDIEDCLSEIQRPKIDEYDKYLFIVLHLPTMKGRGDKRHVETSEVKIFIGKNYLVTIHENNKTIEKVIAKVQSTLKTKKDYMALGTGYLLYMIVDDLFEDCFPILDDLSDQVNELEVEVFDMGKTRDRLKEILMLKKDLINLRRIIMPQRAVIAQLEHKNKKFIPEDLDLYFDDIVDKIEKIWNNIGNLQELASSVHETNESIISHTTNKTIKTLTTISVIMLPLTFITGFYGMNIVGLPYAEAQDALRYVFGLLVGVVLLMVLYFKYRKWL